MCVYFAHKVSKWRKIHYHLLYNLRVFIAFKDTLGSEIDTILSDLKRLKCHKLELGGSNKKITNIINNQGPKIYLYFTDTITLSASFL